MLSDILSFSPSRKSFIFLFFGITGKPRAHSGCQEKKTLAIKAVRKKNKFVVCVRGFNSIFLGRKRSLLWNQWQLQLFRLDPQTPAGSTERIAFFKNGTDPWNKKSLSHFSSYNVTGERLIANWTEEEKRYRRCANLTHNFRNFFYRKWRRSVLDWPEVEKQLKLQVLKRRAHPKIGRMREESFLHQLCASTVESIVVVVQVTILEK